MVTKRILSLATLDRIFLSATGHVNIDLDGLKEFGKILERYGLEILKSAVKMKDHAKRKTIKGKDIELALNLVKEFDIGFVD